jgi:hypothetical protein
VPLRPTLVATLRQAQGEKTTRLRAQTWSSRERWGAASLGGGELKARIRILKGRRPPADRRMPTAKSSFTRHSGACNRKSFLTKADTRNGPGQNRAEPGTFGHIWAELGRIGQNWADLGSFGPFSPRAGQGAISPPRRCTSGGSRAAAMGLSHADSVRRPRRRARDVTAAAYSSRATATSPGPGIFGFLE